MQTVENNTVESLIGQAALAEAREREKKEAEQAAYEKAALSAIEEALGDLAEQLGPSLRPYRVEGRSVVVPVEAGALELAPFELVASGSGQGSLSVTARVSNNYRAAGQISAPHIFAAFLKERREAFHAAKAREREAEYKELGNRLARRSIEHDAREEAEATLARMAELFPDRAGEAREAFASWESWAGERAEWLRAEAQLKREKRAALEQYRAEFEAYRAALEAVRARNESRVRRLLPELDAPFDVWELTYALVADDGEGDRVADTSTVWLLAPEPDAADFYETAYHGRRKYFNPVSLSDRRTVKPSEKVVHASHYGVWRGGTIYTHPRVEREELLAKLGLEAEPERPERADILQSRECYEIEHPEGDELSGMAEEF
jgi:phage terminase small subunit